MRCPNLSDLPSPPPVRTGWPWSEASPRSSDAMPNGSPWPRISIVTPSYNQGCFLEETIRSVLLQGYPNLEYIIMDGGSTDGSVEIIHKYEPWLSYVHTGPDGGQSAAIGEGFRHATGEILAWINSDDRYLPGAFARVARFFAAHPRVAFGSGDINHVDAEGILIKLGASVRPAPFLSANIPRHRWWQQGAFWRRAAYEAVGGMDASLHFCMDLDLFIRLTRAYPSRRIPGPPLADFRTHPLAKSMTMKPVQRAEGAALLRKYGNPKLLRYKRYLSYLWLLWCVPACLREGINRCFRWFARRGQRLGR